MQEKEYVMTVWCGLKNLSLGITVRLGKPRDAEQCPCLVMPSSDPRNRFYLHQTAMIDSYYTGLHRQVNTSDSPLNY